MQSDYHNTPRINGKSECAGQQFKAEVINYKTGQLTLDISKAYPQSANVNRWYRTISTCSNKHIEIIEDFDLELYECASQLYLITPIKPSLVNKDEIIIKDCSIHFNSLQLSPQIEDLGSLIDPVLSRVWGNHLYRIVLTVRSRSLKQRIHYYITYN